MSKNIDWYIIHDLDKFVESTRLLVYNSFGEQNKKDPDELSFIIEDLTDEEKVEFDEVLLKEESLRIIQEYLKPQINKKTQEKRYLVSDIDFLKIVESLNERMVSNMLSGLVKKGILESGFDEESNDFIFWIKDEDDNKKD
jgi:hypothetical protein